MIRPPTTAAPPIPAIAAAGFSSGVVGVLPSGTGVTPAVLFSITLMPNDPSSNASLVGLPPGFLPGFEVMSPVVNPPLDTCILK